MTAVAWPGWGGSGVPGPAAWQATGLSGGSGSQRAGRGPLSGGCRGGPSQNAARQDRRTGGSSGGWTTPGGHTWAQVAPPCPTSQGTGGPAHHRGRDAISPQLTATQNPPHQPKHSHLGQMRHSFGFKYCPMHSLLWSTASYRNVQSRNTSSWLVQLRKARSNEHTEMHLNPKQ